jgi:hypothetical protein
MYPVNILPGHLASFTVHSTDLICHSLLLLHHPESASSGLSQPASACKLINTSVEATSTDVDVACRYVSATLCSNQAQPHIFKETDCWCLVLVPVLMLLLLLLLLATPKPCRRRASVVDQSIDAPLQCSCMPCLTPLQLNEQQPHS